MAHHNLVQGNYSESLKLCQDALEKDASLLVKSDLLAWSAVCMAELNYPENEIRAAFKLALEFNPSNLHAKENLTGFEESRKIGRTKPWIWESEEEAQAIGQAEHRPSIAGRFSLAA